MKKQFGVLTRAAILAGSTIIAAYLGYRTTSALENIEGTAVNFYKTNESKLKKDFADAGKTFEKDKQLLKMTSDFLQMRKLDDLSYELKPGVIDTSTHDTFVVILSPLDGNTIRPVLPSERMTKIYGADYERVRYWMEHPKSFEERASHTNTMLAGLMGIFGLLGSATLLSNRYDRVKKANTAMGHPGEFIC